MPEPQLTPLMPSLISIPADYGKTIPSRGRSSSPIRLDPSAEKLRRAPSRTFIPLALPIDILEFPRVAHPRIDLAIGVSSPVLMGGATAEGVVNLTIDRGNTKARASTKLPTLSIDRMSVSIVGIERSGARQHIFRCLMTDLIDEAHPPPVDMASPDQPVSDRLWEVKPSTTMLPFRLDLPIMLGPPPYKTRKNTITYLVSVLVEAKIGGKRSYVRESEEITVLTVHDPEKALLNLPNPLVVTEEVQTSHRGSLETVKLTAGVHRQTWISGYPLFVDVRIGNHGSKIVKKVELQLERLTFIYAYAAPSEDHGLSDTLRLPDRCEKEVILKVSSQTWQTQAHSSDLKTCSLSIPPGLVSVDAGRFFGVRYFLNIRIAISFSKHLAVQLPVTLIHPVSTKALSLSKFKQLTRHNQNSIDIPPNSLAQVAAAIEHKHRNLHPLTPDMTYNYRPGQAFLAARRQSFDQAARKTISQEEINSIASALDDDHNPGTGAERITQQARRRASTPHIAPHPNPNPTWHSKEENPRLRYRNSRFLEGTHSFRNHTPASQAERLPPAPPAPPPTRPPPVTRPPMHHQQPVIPSRKTHRSSMDEYSSRQADLGYQQHRRTKTVDERYGRGPRLQRSTSGLKFSSEDDDDEIAIGEGDGDRRTRLRKRMQSESQRPLRLDF
ncbi:MAG: hypothetical protein Q9168_007496 [Polycauliona sp. 1 TL-2023]